MTSLPSRNLIKARDILLSAEKHGKENVLEIYEKRMEKKRAMYFTILFKDSSGAKKTLDYLELNLLMDNVFDFDIQYGPFTAFQLYCDQNYKEEIKNTSYYEKLSEQTKNHIYSKIEESITALDILETSFQKELKSFKAKITDPNSKMYLLNFFPKKLNQEQIENLVDNIDSIGVLHEYESKKQMKVKINHNDNNEFIYKTYNKEKKAVEEVPVEFFNGSKKFEELKN